MKSQENIPVSEDTDIDEYTELLVKAALAEDVGGGDITTEAVVGEKKRGKARIIAKEDFVVAGMDVARKVFEAVDERLRFKALVKDGERIKEKAVLAELSGRLASILTAERVALNFLQRLSAVATLTSRFVEKIKGTGAMVLDTRKTTPCMRILERYAVNSGGGVNHRFGLFDAILIKDNHIASAGGVLAAIKRTRKASPEGVTIEVEARNLKEVREAIKGGADTILLDNMDVAKIRKAVAVIGGKAAIEVSGGITLKNIGAVARAGADFISVGAITHSAGSVDISLDVKQ